MELRVCRKCHLEKPITEFTVEVKASGKRRAWCKPCEAARVRAYYAANAEYREKTKKNSTKWANANPEKAAVHRYRSGLKYKYNMTPEQYRALLAAQGERCALCGSPDHGRRVGNGKTPRLSDGSEMNWPIDHCHETGRVRGILCFGCNTRLGGYERLLKDAGESRLREYLAQSSLLVALLAPPDGPPEPAYRRVDELPPRYVRHTCSVEGCDKPVKGKGLCQTHYMRVRRGRDAGPAATLPHAGSKLTDDDIRAIRASEEKNVAIAARYGISQATVSMIRSRKIWTHIA